MRLALPLLLAAAACGGGGTGGNGDDTPPSDAAATSDANAQPGLIVSFAAIPALPGTLKTDLTVTSAVFHIERLQVIGDNGQPMTGAFTLGWQSESTNPSPLDFPSAPSGLYSQVSMEIDQPLLAPVYEIFGTAKIGGNIEPFHIVDREDLHIDITGYNVTLVPGRSAVIGIRLDLKGAVENIDMNMLPTEQGMRTLETGNSQMSEFRDKLEDAFKRSP